MNRVQLLERALEATPGAAPSLSADLASLEEGLRDVQEALSGDPTARRRQEPSPPSLLQRLGRITGGAWSSSLGEPTSTQERQYEIIAQELGGILERLRTLVEVDLERIEDAAEAAGAPWTSGRVPSWRP